ncbi:MAG: phosphate ABC transporter permease subunit PstC, partial [Burkholderiaceae bacterium]
MSASASSAPVSAVPSTAATRSAQRELAARVRRFALQDRLFAALTFFFAALVLASLLGILVSLLIGAWPALSQFGLEFF